MSEQFVIGIDGGGTAANVIAARMDGSILYQFQAGALNQNGQSTDKMEAAFKDILLRIEELKLKIEDCRGICIGSAGISNTAAIAVITKIFKNAGMTAPIKIVGDHETALAGAFEELSGIILISGTGSICFGADESGRQYRAGGYGHVIDDAGSAYAIGRDMLKAVVREMDGRGSTTVLTSKILDKLRIEKEELITWLYQPERAKKEIAALAVLLEDGIREEDQASIQILKDCVMELVKLAKAVLVHFESIGTMAVSGSVLMKNDRIYHMFCENMKLEYPKLTIQRMEGSAAIGAVRMIRKQIERGESAH